ncbi:phosphodiesterase [Pseudoponticoccus marisrubri]|uniref:Phosphodiesterase n=2 Tax=Pseudoponticoccus marisrubri TaxID=1685382 RepID=A0A0W7WKC0_9RHOB|nr:phosphodiesterase [Pseudoponticoccus marisrubri]
MTSLPEPFLSVPLAHRALHDRAAGRPENSRAAVRAAIEAGYGIEIDLQLSRDGVAMVFHDETLDRLTGESGPVRARDADALARIALSGGDEGIPTLSEILQIVGGRVPLLVEIKDQDGALGPGVGALEEAAAAALSGYAGPVACMSFNPHSMTALGRAVPALPRGLTTCAFAAADWPEVPEERRAALTAIGDLSRVGGSFVSHDHRALDAPRLAEIRSEGLPVLTWTIRSPAEEAAARRVADNITFEGYAP